MLTGTGENAVWGPPAVVERVAALLGRESVDPSESVPVAMPESDAETAAVIRVARECGWRVHPAGSGLGPWPGRPSSGGVVPDLVVSTRKMSRVVDHEPGDLTVRARGGSTMALLHATVSASGQWLPLDPPGGRNVTLGGAVATGLPGPLSAQFGRPRDQLLGLTLVDGGGRILALGGRVVKNVAGFDLVRLATGSRGALGVITETTFRLHPLPEEDRVLVWRFSESRAAWSTGRKLATLPVPIAAAEVVQGEWPSPVPDGGARVLFRLVGSAGAVARVAERMIELAGEPDGTFEGAAAEAIFGALSKTEGERGPGFRVHALPSLGGNLLPLIEDLKPKRFSGHLLGGTFRVAVSGGGSFRPVLLSERFQAAGGHCRMWGDSRRLEVGGPESGAAKVRAAIATEFDPSGILPGSWE